MSVADTADPTDPGPGGPRVTNLAARRAGKQVPPQDLDTERALLAAALIDPTAATIVAALDPGVFYSPAHAHIADAVRQLDAGGDPIDPLTVLDQLAGVGLLDVVGGHQALVDIMATSGAPSSAATYARNLSSLAKLRQIIGAAGEAALAAYARDRPRALAWLEQVLDQPDESDAFPIGDRLDAHLTLLEERQAGHTTTIPTGLTDLDHIIGGLRPGELYVIAGRPGMGKTAVGGQLALNLAQAGTRTLFVTIEMSTVELTDRWISNLSGVDISRIHAGQLGDRQWHDIAAKAIGQLATLPVDVLDAPTVTLPKIRATARATGARAVVIDYLQLVQATGPTANRQEAVAEVARGAKNLARALDVPVVALAQLHRGVESRVEKRPTLADLRDSGEIENSAGIVIGLYRHDYYHPGATTRRGELEAIVLKNRHGGTDTARLAFQGAWQRVVNLALPGARP